VDRWLGSVFVLGALLLYFVVAPGQVSMPRLRLGEGGGTFVLSPLFFPRLVAVALGLLGALLFVRGRSREEALRDGEGFALSGAELARIGGTVLIMVLYLAALEPLGYLLATPLALAALMVFLGSRRWGLIIVVAIAATAVVYVGFRKGMLILLPGGIFD